eukprot:COSAG02_NODE_9676_length_2146_cov_1.671226_1_plen_51_part_00
MLELIVCVEVAITEFLSSMLSDLKGNREPKIAYLLSYLDLSLLLSAVSPY